MESTADLIKQVLNGCGDCNLYQTYCRNWKMNPGETVLKATSSKDPVIIERIIEHLQRDIFCSETHETSNKTFSHYR